MSVESVRIVEGTGRTCNLYDDHTDPTAFAASDFDHLMHGEGSNGENCHPFFAQLSRLNELLSSESAMVNNGPQIRQQIESLIAEGIDSGFIDLDQLAESEEVSGIKMLTDRIGIESQSANVQVRIGSDADANPFQPLSTVSSQHMTAIGLEFSGFAASAEPHRFTMTTPLVSDANGGQQDGAADRSTGVTAYSAGSEEVETTDPTPDASTTTSGHCALPAEWPALAERLRNSEIPDEARQPGQPSQEAAYIMAARRAEDLYERVQNGEMSKSNVNDLGHALQQMANVRLGLHVHSANRHELEALSKLANGKTGGEQWTGLSQAQRDESLAAAMGMDTETWAKEIRPLIDQSTQFHEMREDMSFKIDDAAKIVVAAAATYFTAGAASAGAFGAAFSTSAGSAFAGGFAGSFVSSGGDLGEAVEGGVTGAVTGGLLGGYGGSASENLKTFGQNAAIRGIAEEVQGGDFEDGVLSEATNFIGGELIDNTPYPDSLSNWNSDTVRQFTTNTLVKAGIAEATGGSWENALTSEAASVLGQQVSASLAEQGISPYFANAAGRAVTSRIINGDNPQAATHAVVNGVFNDHKLAEEARALAQTQNVPDSADDDMGLYDPANDFGDSFPDSGAGTTRLVNVGTGYLDIDSGEFSPHTANVGSVAVNPVTGTIDVVTADGTTTEINSGDLAETFRDVGKNLLSRVNIGIGLMLYSEDLGSTSTYNFTNPDGSESEHLSDLRVEYDYPMGIGSIQKQLDDGSWIHTGYLVRRDGMEENSPFVISAPGDSQLPGYGNLDADELANLNIPPYPADGSQHDRPMDGFADDSGLDTGEMDGFGSGEPINVPVVFPGHPPVPVTSTDDIIIQNTNVNWTTPDVRIAAEGITKYGATEVFVENRAQAEEIFLAIYASKQNELGIGYRNTTGLSPAETKDLFNNKNGTYHWDEANNAYPHGADHLQIHTFDGAVIRIYFE